MGDLIQVCRKDGTTEYLDLDEVEFVVSDATPVTSMDDVRLGPDVVAELQAAVDEESEQYGDPSFLFEEDVEPQMGPTFTTSAISTTITSSNFAGYIPIGNTWSSSITYTGTASYSNNSWSSWHGRQVSDEELVRAAQQIEARSAEVRERERERLARMAEVDKVADQWLRTFLDDNQEACWDANGYFVETTASGRRWEITRRSRMGNVYLLDNDQPGIERRACFCLITDDLDYPPCDQVVAQLLLLRFHEEEFFQRANRHWGDLTEEEFAMQDVRFRMMMHAGAGGYVRMID